MSTLRPHQDPYAERDFSRSYEQHRSDEDGLRFMAVVVAVAAIVVAVAFVALLIGFG